MHTVQYYRLSRTNHVYQCGKQGRTVMPLIILKWKNRLEKVRRICTEFTKVMCRICKLHAENFQFFVVHNSENQRSSKHAI